MVINLEADLRQDGRFSLIVLELNMNMSLKDLTLVEYGICPIFICLGLIATLK